MGTLIVYAIICVAPALLIKIGIEATRYVLDWTDHRHSVPVRRRSVDDMAATLGRLRREYERVEQGSMPARATRLKALGMAYDDTLRECCAELGLPAPEGSPLGAVDRLETEAALAQCGLNW